MSGSPRRPCACWGAGLCSQPGWAHGKAWAQLAAEAPSFRRHQRCARGCITSVLRPVSHLLRPPMPPAMSCPVWVRVGGGLAIAIGCRLAAGAHPRALGRAVGGYLEPDLHFGRSLPAVALSRVFIVIFQDRGHQMEVASSRSARSGRDPAEHDRCARSGTGCRQRPRRGIPAVGRPATDQADVPATLPERSSPGWRIKRLALPRPDGDAELTGSSKWHRLRDERGSSTAST